MGLVAPLVTAFSGLAAFAVAFFVGGPAIVAFGIVATMGALIALLSAPRPAGH